jgi:mannose-6-phosphate isomerase-like protein (cupin superfamily)
MSEPEPIKLDGEKVYEMFTSKDDLPIGIAVADIEESKLHHHARTHEFYCVMRGYGNIEIDGKTVRVNEGDVQYIQPGSKHRAFAIQTPGLPAYHTFMVFVVSSPPWTKEDHILD